MGVISPLGWYVVLPGPADGVLRQQGASDDPDQLAVAAQACVYLFRRQQLESILDELMDTRHRNLAQALRAEDRFRRQELAEAQPIFAALTQEGGPLGAWAALREVETLERLGDGEAAQRRLLQSRSRVQDEPSLLRSMVEARLAFRKGRVERAAETLSGAADDLVNAPEPLIGGYHRAWAIYYSLQGSVPRSLLHHRLAMDSLNSLGDAFMLAKESLSLGQTYLEIGELDHAAFFFRKAEETVEEMENAPLEALLASRLGLLALVRGDLRAARGHFEKDLELSRDGDHAHGRAFARRNLGKVAARTGDPRFGHSLLVQSRTDFEELCDTLNRELARLEEVSALLSAEGVSAADEVSRRLDRLHAYFERLDRPVMLAQVQGVHARLLAEQGKLELARQEMEDATRTFLRCRRPDRLVDSLLSFAETLQRLDERDEAIRNLGTAHRVAMSAGRPWLASTVIEHVGRISERAVMDLVGESHPPTSRATATERAWYEQTLLDAHSPAVRDLLDAALAVAPTEETVLIEGETGTGKEILARLIHTRSRRSDAPFTAINCGAITEGLLESELFGHEKGAFTGATHQRIGLFEHADGGIVFLDEVGELSPHGQVTLLRFLQDRQVRPVGSSTTRSVDVRLMAATNRELVNEVRDGVFREDLYYRLAVFPLRVPALRERPDDLPMLIRQFLAHNPHAQEKGIDALGDPAQRLLCDHAWPGNLRELDNVLRSAAIRCKGSRLLKRDLPATLHTPVAGAGGFPSLDEALRRHVLEAMRISDGRKGKAAALLGIHRNTLRNKLRDMDSEG